MHRYQCVLTMLALYGGVVQSFSWDVVISRANRLEFYNEGTLTNSVAPTANIINWITYDPFHDRVLFTETVSIASRPVFSFDIATGKTETLINLKRFFWKLVYDPARELLIANILDENNKKSIKSFLVKPGSDVEAKGNHVIELKMWTKSLATDTCRGYIYWTTIYSNCMIEKIQFNGTDREALYDGCKGLIKTGLAIDPQTQKIYWTEHQKNITEFFSADLNGNNKRLLYKEKMQVPNAISLSKDYIYWVDTTGKPFFWQLPKNTSRDTDVKPIKFLLNTTQTDSDSSPPTINAIATNYAIEEQTQGNPNCKALTSLLPKYSTNRDIPVCHNYCLQGYCSTSADGQPKCRCNAGYSGQRCEVNMCLEYCLNKGVCSMNEKNQPVCRCSGGFEGARCDASIFLTKFVQAFINKTTSMINDILKEDGTSDTE